MPFDVQERPQTVSAPEKKGNPVDPVLDRMLSAFETSMRGKAGNPDAQRSTQALFGAAIAQWARDSVSYEQKQSIHSSSVSPSEVIPEVAPILPPTPTSQAA